MSPKSRGSWIIISVIVIYSLLFWWSSYEFMKGNVWRNGQMQNASELRRQVDFLQLRIKDFVEQTDRSILSFAVLSLVYVFVRLGRLEARLRKLESKEIDRPPG